MATPTSILPNPAPIIPTTLDIYQQVFCFSMQICAAAKQQDSPPGLAMFLTKGFEALFTQLQDTKYGVEGTWELVWGPAVFQSPSSRMVDQAIAVCYNAAQNMYVVPIAATSPCSPFMIYLEDLAASPGSQYIPNNTPPAPAPYYYLQPFPNGGPGFITYGNYVALEQLLQLSAAGLAISGNTGKLPGAPMTLQTYLTYAANSSATLAFCGHSLGGGLTPLLAYALYPKGTNGGPWKAVYTFPTAGPSTADGLFAAAFKSAYPAVPSTPPTPSSAPPQYQGNYQYWNVNQYNARDVVPQAWSVNPGAATNWWQQPPNLNNLTAAFSDILGDNEDAALFWLADSLENSEVYVTVIALRTMTINYATPQPTDQNPNAGVSPYEQINSNPFFLEPPMVYSAQTGTWTNAPIGAMSDLSTSILYQHIQAYIVDGFAISGVLQAASGSSSSGAMENIHPPLMTLLGHAGSAATAAVAAAKATPPAKAG